MESYYVIERPSLLPVLCAPMSASWLPTNESIVVPAAERAQLPQVHQVRIQAELARTAAATGGNHATYGFVGNKGTASTAKRMTDGANGVPPRGRPV